MTSAYKSPADLPEAIPVFPLPGALLLPRGQMPLNIFEPRYLAMVDDALRSSRLIGMIQPQNDTKKSGPPKLCEIGCVGRITQFAETGDDRYMLSLTGIARFKVIEELNTITPYRKCRVSYEPFVRDFEPRAGEEAVDRPGVIRALKDYVTANDISVDWQGIEAASNEALINALAMMSPFGPREKQALLEAVDLKQRADLLVAITEFELARREDGSETPLQ